MLSQPLCAVSLNGNPPIAAARYQLPTTLYMQHRVVLLTASRQFLQIHAAALPRFVVHPWRPFRQERSNVASLYFFDMSQKFSYNSQSQTSALLSLFCGSFTSTPDADIIFWLPIVRTWISDTIFGKTIWSTTILRYFCGLLHVWHISVETP